MQKLTDREMQDLRILTRDLLLEVRAQYLAAGASPLKHWDQLADRLRAAIATTATPEELVTSLLRGLNLSAPSSSVSWAMVRLSDEVAAMNATRPYFDMLEREYALVHALTRLEAEDRKERRAATAAGGAA